VLAWIHVALAFHYFDAWSYAHAAEETSRRTAEVVGRSWGGEIWFNFAFLALWAIDAAWRWAKPEWIPRLAFPSAVIQFYLLFIAFNATVVFERGPVKAAGTLGSVLLAIAIGIRIGLSRRARERANPTVKPAL
jgi:hypothetical protein